MTKSIFVSKTFWLNFLSAAVAILESTGVTAMLSPGSLPYVVAVVGVLNILLRLITNQGVHVTGTGDGQ